MSTINQPPAPCGELTLQTIAMPKDTNASGDIFGGWLMSQMDLGSAIMAQRIAKGRVATVAISEMAFLRPVPVGAIVSCYCELVEVGRSSMSINVEVWINIESTNEPAKVTEGQFVFVAIDENGNTRKVDQQLSGSKED
ncbi:acyl-CoA thioesterase [Porticoccus litoralis]|uniref:Acyl-CoA thioesterase n=1 Tax=Porticoccus litoralis TaxID=434086 RepID=A0AAW8B4S0_9GAMM|nr:acyl-CoA thioesterase [Porticoccus litoralis]MDP1520737.1 acyl-CoA thioesterase [Porticoccus litoralis]TNE93714.1 MAG: acyl-CoA thioesterase [Gammaproteobacteria bacterium]